MDEEDEAKYAARDEAMDEVFDETMDRKELENLLCEHYEYVRKLAWKYVDADEFEDLANDAMTDAYEGLDSLREPDYIKSWLYTIVRNNAKAYYAREDKRRKIDEAVRLAEGSAEPDGQREFAAGEAAFREMMQRAEYEDLAVEIMAGLDSVHKRIMYMKFWDGHTFSEIGEIMGIKAVTVRSMYIRCRDRLCEKYKDVGKEAGLYAERTRRTK